MCIQHTSDLSRIIHLHIILHVPPDPLCHSSMHVQKTRHQAQLLAVTGTGMSEPELQRNPILTDYTVRDLNKQPKLPYEDNSFDVITNVVSVDYLNKPLVS